MEACKAPQSLACSEPTESRIPEPLAPSHKKRRTYTSFPGELSPFYVKNAQKPFKKENLRQSLARAVQTLKLMTENRCAYKRGLVHPKKVSEEVIEEVRHIIASDREHIESFIYPKTCLRQETRKSAKYRSKDRSWNSKKWEEFRNIAGIKSLLSVVLTLSFQSKDLDELCDLWDRDCCRGRMHCEENCAESWRKLQEFCRRDCGLTDSQSEASTGVDFEEEIGQMIVEDPDYFLNLEYCL